MDVKWIKIDVNIFDHEKIKLIEGMPESDAIINIWFRLMLMAGKTNDDGLIYMAPNVPYTDEMLEALWPHKLNIIRLAFDVFKKYRMIEIEDDGTIILCNFCIYQDLDRLETIKQQNRMRQASFKKRQKEKRGVTLPLTLGNATEESRLDKSIYSRLVGHLNDKTGAKYRSTTRRTQKFIDARLSEGYKEADFIKVIDTKVDEWLHNNKMNCFLRPETLFGPKFESYFNQKATPQAADTPTSQPYQPGTE